MHLRRHPTIILTIISLLLLVGAFFMWRGWDMSIRNAVRAMMGGPHLRFSHQMLPRDFCDKDSGNVPCGVPESSWQGNDTFEVHATVRITCASFGNVIGTYALHDDALAIQYRERLFNPMFCAFPQELTYTFTNLPKREYRVTLERL
ncbi:MAG: hypothetical protein WCS85_05465 [Candidatus Peribacteraceae bacterium]|jgi:hypothetical protein